MSSVPGVTLTDQEWLRARIAEMGRSWGVPVPRVAGTLWWYMVASALVEQLAGAYAAGAAAPRPRLDRLDCAVRPDGGVDRVRILAPAEAVEGSPASALHDTLAAVITPVARVSGAGAAALWAIAADAVGNRALDAGDPAAAVRLATEVGGRLPVPRFVEVRGRTFVHRLSCCLILEVPGCAMCLSCPRRRTEERLALLAKSAGRS